MDDFVQLISAKAETYRNDILSESKHMPSIFLISFTKRALFSYSKSQISTYMGYFWTTVEISSQINIIIVRKEWFVEEKKKATL